MELTSRGRTLRLQHRTSVIGVINVTPDSFYDGGTHLTSENILTTAKEYLDSGADVIEIGGESTGPTSIDVSLDEERARVLPAVTLLRKTFPDAWIAVDTYKSVIADEVLTAGADMINDITAGRGDEQMFAVIAEAQCPIVLMYSKDSSPRTSVSSMQYDDVLRTIHDFLSARMQAAKHAGITQMMIDPGLGHFVSADPAYSWEILTRLTELVTLGPLLLSPSRKSFLAGRSALPPSERLAATLAASCLASIQGASFIRTHDVARTREVLDAVCGIVR